MSEIEFDPVDHITVGAVGPPGERVFMIQARRGTSRATLILEKGHVVALGRETFDLLSVVGLPEMAAYDPKRMALDETSEPSFRVGEIRVGYDRDRDLIVMECRESVEEEEEDEAVRSRALFSMTREQMATLARHGLEVAARGRPLCPFCQEPMDDPATHECRAANGKVKRWTT